MQRKKCPDPERILWEIIWAKTDVNRQLLDSKISNASEITVCSFFYVLGIRREFQEDYTRWEKTRWGLDYRTINKILCSCGYSFNCYFFWHFKCVLMHKNNGQGNLNMSLKIFMSGAWLPTLTSQLGVYDQITLWGYFQQNPFFIHSRYEWTWSYVMILIFL